MIVSIILPTRDRPGWLPQAVASVRNQTDGDWQLVILDNSPTPVYQQGEGPASNPWFDPRILYVHQQCAGVADAYNKALELATGDVVVPLGDDDRLHEFCVRRVKDVFAGHPEVRWANARTEIVRDGWRVALRGGNQESVDRTRGGEYWLGGAVWWRRELTVSRGFDPRFDGAADFDLYLRFLEDSDPMLVGEVHYVYTDWPGTDSRQRLGVQLQHSRTIAQEWAARSVA